MSQTKVQLIQPIGIMTAPDVNVSGTLTATTFDGNLVGAAGSIAGTPNVNAGIFTATSFYGPGIGLSGVPSGPAYVGQSTAAQSGTTTIDLSTGNVIYFTQDTDTTVAFANTESVQEVRFIRVKDDTTTARTITWPASIIWNGGTTPTLIDSDQTGDVQMFNLTTRDQGVTWYGYESMKNDPANPTPAGFYIVGGGVAGELGQNDAISRSSPVQIPGTQWANVAAGRLAGPFATKTDGTLWIWGNGSYGALGLNDDINRSSPHQLPGTQWGTADGKMSGRFYGCSAIKTNGTLWIWGLSDFGQAGQNARQDHRSSPVQVPGTQWDSLFNFNYQIFATKTDGTLWVWGYNESSAMLGLNSAAHRSSPTQLPGTSWGTITGQQTALATKTDGTLWTWGNGSYGGLGLNDVQPRSSPQQIPGTQWNSVKSVAAYMGLATKTDGTLWAWGWNTTGQLGLNDLINYSSPVQVSGTQWDEIKSAGYNSWFATKTDGTLWTSGVNSTGKLGLNDRINRSSPIQLPGTAWNTSKIASGDTATSIIHF